MKKLTKAEMQSRIDHLENQLSTVHEDLRCMKMKFEAADKEVRSRRDQISDINQWSALLINSRSKLNERVVWSIIGSISNRTTD